VVPDQTTGTSAIDIIINNNIIRHIYWKALPQLNRYQPVIINKSNITKFLYYLYENGLH
jgi:hypothetical protein